MALGDIHRHFSWQAWHKFTSTVVLRGRRGTIWHPRSFCVAGAALMVLGGALGPDLSPVTPRHFAWQAWHLVTSTFISRGRRGTHGTAWRAWSGFVACDAAALCVAGTAFGDIHVHFTWQVWHKLTSTIVLRGRRGTYGIGWRAWSGFVACDAAALCVAGVAFGDIHVHFTWQAWHKLTSTCVLGGRRGTYGIGWRAWSGFVARDAAVCGAGVVLGDIHLHFTWQAWHMSPVTPRLFAWQAWRCARDDYQPQGMQKEFAKFAVALERVQNITLVSGGMVNTIALIACRDKAIRAWWNSKKAEQLTHTRTCTNSLPPHTYMHAYIHTYRQTDRHTDIQTYIHTYMHISLRHTQLFHHVLCLSFFPVPAATFGAHYWKKLICGVIRSFNSSTALTDIHHLLNGMNWNMHVPSQFVGK